MKKRLISVFMIIAMLCTLTGISVAAEENGTIVISADKEFVKRGETVTYTVSTNGMSGILGAQIGILYDKEKAAYEEGSVTVNTNLFTDYSGFTQEAGKFGFAFGFEESTDYTGVIAEFTLRVFEDADLGKLGISADKILIAQDEGTDVNVNAKIEDSEIVSDYNVSFDTVADSADVSIGDEVTYTISMSPLTLKGMQFSVEYDDTYLEFVESAVIGNYSMIKSSQDKKESFVFYNKEDTEVSGELVSLTFKVKYAEESLTGIAPVRVTGFKAVSSAEPLDTSYSCNAGKININKSDKVAISFVPDKLIAGSGEVISYTASLNGINEYKGIQTALKYETSMRELRDVEKLSLMSAADAAFNTNLNGTIGIVCLFKESTSTTGGDLARINFRVKDDIAKTDFAYVAVGSTKVSVDGENYLDADYYTEADEVYVYAGNKVEIEAQPSETLIIPGETVTYSFNISEVSGFKGMQFKMNYDSDALECINIAKGSVLDSAVVKTIVKTGDGVIQGMLNYKNGYTGSGEIFSVTFMAKQVDSLMQPEIYFPSFTSEDYIVYDVIPVDLYPTEPALEAINAIDAIGEVTIEDKALIEYARSVYDNLSEEIKERVSNYDKLTAAEAEYQRLYDALSVFECKVNDGVVELIQNKPCDEKLKLYIAQYNSDGALIDVDIHDISGTKAYPYTKDTDTSKVRCFVWYSDMKAYTDVEYK